MRDDLRIMAFGLGTFHAVVLVLVLLMPLFLFADLGEALEGLSTALGLAIFAALWVSSVYCTHRGLRDAGFHLAEKVSVRNLMSSGSIWGTWNGVLFFWALLAGGSLLLLAEAVTEGETPLVGVLVFSIAGFGVGTVFAAPIGAFVGTVFTAVDLALLSLAKRLAGVHN